MVRQYGKSRADDRTPTPRAKNDVSRFAAAAVAGAAGVTAESLKAALAAGMRSVDASSVHAPMQAANRMQ